MLLFSLGSGLANRIGVLLAHECLLKTSAGSLTLPLKIESATSFGQGELVWDMPLVDPSFSSVPRTTSA